MHRIPRWVPTVIAVILGSGIVAPLVQANWQRWAEKHGYDLLLLNHVEPAMDRLASFTQSPIFLFLTAVFAGGAWFLWADFFVRRWSSWANGSATLSIRGVEKLNALRSAGDSSLYEDILNATVHQHYETCLRSIENFLIRYQVLTTHMSREIDYQMFDSLIKNDSETAQKAIQEFVQWRNATRSKLVSLRRGISP